MTFVKTNHRKRLFPWNSNPLQNFLGYDDFFNDDFFAEDSLLPAMNVKENEGNFKIEFAAPGFSKKDFDISIDNNILNVSGENIKCKWRKKHRERREGRRLLSERI